MATRAATSPTETIRLDDLDKAAAERIEAAGVRVHIANTGLSVVPDEFLDRMQAYARARLSEYLEKHRDLNADVSEEEIIAAVLADDSPR